MSLTTEQANIVNQAIQIIRESYANYSTGITSSQTAKNLASLRLATEEREHFMVMFLNNQHKLIKDEILFSGTIDAAAVYPREIAKRSLELNAAAVIIAHNHPTGDPEPSQADINITTRIRKALELLDIRLLDHIIVGKEPLALSDRGLV